MWQNGQALAECRKTTSLHSPLVAVGTTFGKRLTAKMTILTDRPQALPEARDVIKFIWSATSAVVQGCTYVTGSTSAAADASARPDRYASDDNSDIFMLLQNIIVCFCRLSMVEDTSHRANAM